MIQRRVAMFVAMVFTISVLAMIPCFALEDRQVVRVALPLQDGFTQRDESGALSGYSYEYLERISQINGWKLVYTVFDEDEDINVNLMNAINAVKSGEADIVDTILRSDALEEDFTFPENSSGIVYNVLSSLIEDSEITESDYMALSPLRVAVLEKAKTRNAELVSYLENNRIAYELIPCETAEDQYQALIDDRADVMLRMSVNYTPDTRTIVSFAPRPYYFVTTKGNTQLAQQLSAAIDTIKEIYPYFEKDLQEKYFGDVHSEFYLTEEEKDFFADKTTIRALCTVDAAPFVFLGQDGMPCGIAVSILEDFAAEVGLSTEYDIFDRREDFGTVLKGGGYDCILGIPINPEYNSTLGIVTSTPYMRVDTVMFTNPASQNKPQAEQTVALLRGSPQEDAPAAKRIDYYDTTEDCIRAVKNGKADRGYGNLRCVEYYSYSMFASLNLVIHYGEERNMEISTLNTSDTTFLKVLNRYMAGISETKLYEYSSKSAEQNQKNGLETFVRGNLLFTVIFCAIFLFAIFSAVLMIFVTGRMKHKNRQLVLANGAKSEFLARMSHDLRTPMNAIIGMAYLGMESRELSEATQYFQKVHLSGEYLLGLINDTLDMSKIESDKMTLNLQPYYSAEFIASISNIIRPKAEEKHIALTIEVVRDTPRAVLMDKLRTQQIFINLLNNAIKFTPNGGRIDFLLEVLSDVGETASLCFIVRDNGRGMSQAFLQRMYLPFEQEKETTELKESGTGLGLPIVKRLVELMGGTISCQSSLGVGTEFTVMLYPALAAQGAPETGAVDKADAKGREHASLSGKQILIAEDHPLNMEIASKLLEKKGMVITQAKNGREAVEAFANAPIGFFHAILMDIRMPVMDGLAATKEIRGLEQSDAKTVPIIAMTANAYDEDIQKSWDAGMTAHLAKPVEPQRLYETLKSLIR